MQEISGENRSYSENYSDQRPNLSPGDDLATRVADVSRIHRTQAPAIAASSIAASDPLTLEQLPVAMRYPSEIIKSALLIPGEYAVVMISRENGLLLYRKVSSKRTNGVVGDAQVGEIPFVRTKTGVYQAEGKAYHSMDSMIEGLRHHYFMLVRPAAWSSLHSDKKRPAFNRLMSPGAIKHMKDLMGFKLSEAIVLGQLAHVREIINDNKRLLKQSYKHFPICYYVLALAAKQPEIAQTLIDQGLQIEHHSCPQDLAEAYELAFSLASFEQLQPFFGATLLPSYLLRPALQGALKNPSGGHGSRLVNALRRQTKSLEDFLPIVIELGLSSGQLKVYTDEPFWNLAPKVLEAWLQANPQDLTHALKNNPDSVVPLLRYVVQNNEMIRPSHFVPHVQAQELPNLPSLSGYSAAYRKEMVEALRQCGSEGMQKRMVYLSDNSHYIWPLLIPEERLAVINHSKPKNISRVLRAVAFFGTEQEVEAWLQVVSDPKQQWTEFQRLNDFVLFPYRDCKGYHHLLKHQVQQGNLSNRQLQELLTHLFGVGAEKSVMAALEAGVHIPSTQVPELFRHAMVARAPQLVSILAKEKLLDVADTRGVTLLEMAVWENDEVFVKALLQAGVTIHDRKQLLTIARRNHCLPTYKLLSENNTLEGFAYLKREDIKNKLWACFLNSSLDDWLELVKDLPDQACELTKEFLNRGSLIARFSAPHQQKEMVQHYGSSGIDYCQQQMNFSESRLKAYRNLLRAHKEDSLSLFEAYQVLSNPRRLKEYKVWRVAVPSESTFFTPIKHGTSLYERSRYDMFYPLAANELQRRLLRSPSSISSLFSYTVTESASQQPLSSVGFSIGGSVGWFHSDQQTLQRLQDQLSDQFELIKSMKVDISDPKSIKHLKNELALFYSRASHAMPTKRGNAQYVLELHRFLYELHGLEVAPPSRDVALPDCYALCTSPQDFATLHYESCFEKFPETGDIVRPLPKSS